MRVDISFSETRAIETEHWDLLHSVWEKLQHIRRHGTLTINGTSLDIASVVAAARYIPCG